MELKSCRVLVTPTSYGKNDLQLWTELEALVGEVVRNTFGRPLTAGETRGLIKGCDGYIAGLDTIDRAAIEAADRLKIIARYGVGVDGVDLDAAKERSIIVTNTPFANSVSVAELTIGLLFSLARSIPSAVATTKAGQWARPMGITLAGKTVGVIGLGAIGKQVAMRLRHFDCALVAHDPVADAAFAAVHGIELGALDDLLSRADFVTLHVPLLPTTRGMVNAAFLARMKVGSFLINTARGELIDETALLDALQSGRLRGAALDVFSKEPPGDLPLLRLPQVIATPHVGSHTDGATNAMGWTALRDCLAVLRGEQPAHRVA